MRLTPLRAAVLGRPIGHSLSPLLHRAAWAALDLDGTYEAIDCGVAELPGVLSARRNWAGFSCTMPLKHAVLAAAGEIRPTAVAVGSANTLLPGPDGWIADNTDVHGIVAALGEHRVHPATVTVLGAGGTAQAVLAAVRELGVDACTVLMREPARAAALLGTAERLGVAVTVARLGDRALTDDLVVSTLPAGAADPLAVAPWRPGQAVLDVVYGAPSALAQAAGAAGATVVDGRLMLLHQAARQVELMTGRTAPVAAMRSALEVRLGRPAAPPDRRSGTNAPGLP